MRVWVLTRHTYGEANEYQVGVVSDEGRAKAWLAQSTSGTRSIESFELDEDID